MNNPGNFEEDILKQYLNPEKTEKAPESFTTRLMSRIGYEPAFKISEKTHKRSFIPVISAVFIIVLVIIALLLPESNSNNLLLPESDFIKNIEASLSNISKLTLPSFSIPFRLTSVLIGILLIGLLDLAFLRLIHRGNK